MNNIKKIFELLETIHGNGSFETSGINKITSPGLNIKGIGEISLPISPIQIREIIEISKKAPFGKGSKTITDTSVRSAWELNEDELSFRNEDWKDMMGQIAEKVKTSLGIEDNAITISLYKLLIYEEGDFFLSHKDSEKEPGMFGTLIIGLPSIHTGGELVVRFDGKEKVIDFSLPSSNYKIPYVAFFADCDHEVKPITSGYRVSLVYNLLQSAGSPKLGQSETSSQINQMAALLKSMSNSAANKPKAVLLEHQYTPANFSLDSLKHHDRPRAELLLEAAAKAGYFAELGLVTHYKMGELEGDYDYDYHSRYSESSGDGIMGEVYEEDTTIEHWSNGKIPSLGTIHIENEDLITDFKIGEGIPIEEEEERYTGNAGMTMEYWYHYGAVILWPQSKHLELLSLASVPVRLAWLEYYYQNWDDAKLNAIENSKHIITRFAENELTERHLFSTDFSIIARFLLKLKDEKFISGHCEALLAAVFKNIQVNNWIELLQHFAPQIFTRIFERAASKNDIYTINHVLEILKSLSTAPKPPKGALTADLSTALSKGEGENGFKPPLGVWGPFLDKFFQHHVNHIPAWLATIQLSKLRDEDRYAAGDESPARKDIIKAILKKVVELSRYKEKDADWIKDTVKVVTKSLPRNYVNNVLVAIVSNEKGLLAKEIRQICISDLTDRTAVKPTPPADWKRDMPDTKSDLEIWNILKPFIESADTQVFEYKKAQAYRSQMESAIARVTIDLKMETIKKSSPQVLKITKTQAAYQRALKNWEDDVAILQTLH
jgi:hypothetical protein